MRRRGAPLKAGGWRISGGGPDVALDAIRRGQTRDGVPVAAGATVVEMEPRNPAAVVSGPGACVGQVSAEVLAAVWRPLPR